MPRMIRVRSKASGLETTVSEKAFGAFAADYERLDQPAEPEPVAEPQNSKRSRGTAAPSEKE